MSYGPYPSDGLPVIPAKAGIQRTNEKLVKPQRAGMSKIIQGLGAGYRIGGDSHSAGPRVSANLCWGFYNSLCDTVKLGDAHLSSAILSDLSVLCSFRRDTLRRVPRRMWITEHTDVTAHVPPKKSRESRDTHLLHLIELNCYT
jgi:hypothetical protein